MKIFMIFFLFQLTVRAEPSGDFAQTYQKILDLSLRTKIQRANLDIAKAQHLKPIGQFTPQLSLVGKEIQGGDPRYSQRPINLSANMNLFRFGADAFEYKSTALNSKTQIEKLSSEKLGSEEDGLSALFQIIRLEASLDVYRGISETRAELVRIADERYRKGLLAFQEVEKVRVDFENSKAREADTYNDLKDAQANVAALLGSVWSSKVWPWIDLLKVNPTNLVDDFKLEENPQYRASVFAEDSARTFARSQFLRLLPSVDLSFTYGSQDLTSSLPGTSANTYAGIVSLTIPIFDQFTEYSNYEQALGIATQASAQKAYILRELGPQFESAKEKFLNSIESTIRREKNLSVSRKLYDDNFSRFKQARVSVNDLLIDQNRLSDAELLAIESWYNLHLNFERLCHSSGMSVTADAKCVRVSTNKAN